MTDYPSQFDDRGASAVEYSLLVAAIAAIIVLVVVAVGQFTKQTYTDTCSSLAAGYTGVTATCP